MEKKLFVLLSDITNMNQSKSFFQIIKSYVLYYIKHTTTMALQKKTPFFFA